MQTDPLRPRSSASFYRTIILSFLCSVLLSACAVSPQTVFVKPELKAPAMPIGHGRSLKVETYDRRRDTTLGTLGGVYNTAYLSTDTGMEKRINQAAVTVLQSWDFVAVPGSLANQDMPDFTIEILDIDYQRPASSVGGNVVVKCKVAARINKGSETYKGEYVSQRSEQVALMGTVEGNRKLVNQTISQAINQIFLDTKLQRFLAR